MSEFRIDPIYLDNHLLVVKKPAGMLIQGDKSNDKTLLDYSRSFIKEEFSKPGDVYLGLVHRLDRPTGGIVIFARTSKAAARLSEQIRMRSIKKKYLALVEGRTEKYGNFIDRIERQEKTSTISNDNKGQIAKLSFKRIDYKNQKSLLEVNLETGRHHQIRVQFSHRGFPVVGDFKYGSFLKFDNKNIALFAYSIAISHPITKETIVFETVPDKKWERFF